MIICYQVTRYYHEVSNKLKGCIIYEPSKIQGMNWSVFTTNWLHERYLGELYNFKNPSFEELLKRDESVSVHNRNLQIPNMVSLLLTFNIFHNLF